MRVEVKKWISKQEIFKLQHVVIQNEFENITHRSVSMFAESTESSAGPDGSD
jgi:hypothetical protein